MDKKKILKKLTKVIQAGYADDSLIGWESEVEIFEAKARLIATIGEDGDGAKMSYIFKITQDDANMLARIDGYYSSYDHNYFEDDAYEVEEYIKEVKDWRKVK